MTTAEQLLYGIESRKKPAKDAYKWVHKSEFGLFVNDPSTLGREIPYVPSAEGIDEMVGMIEQIWYERAPREERNVMIYTSPQGAEMFQQMVAEHVNEQVELNRRAAEQARRAAAFHVEMQNQLNSIISDHVEESLRHIRARNNED